MFGRKSKGKILSRNALQTKVVFKFSVMEIFSVSKNNLERIIFCRKNLKKMEGVRLNEGRQG